MLTLIYFMFYIIFFSRLIIFFIFHIEQNYVGGGFVAIQDAVKLEPREQTSPYPYGGSYRVQQATPSPTPTLQNPHSPAPLFVAPSTSPYNQQPIHTNNLESILHNQLQAPRINGIGNGGGNNNNNNNIGSNIFQQQQPHTNQIFTPNITPASNVYTLDSNVIWTNNLNGNCVQSTSRAPTTAFNGGGGNNLSMTSPIFNQALQPQLTQVTPAQAYNNNNNNNNIVNNAEQRSNYSSLLDLDSQQLLNNLSGELQNLSFGDIPMDSWSKTNRDK
jgi:hypothetical protein